MRSNNIKSKIKLKIFVLIISLIIVMCHITLLIVNYIDYDIKIELQGNDNISLLFQEEYKESGAKATYCRNNTCKDITDEITITNNIDINKIGHYEVIYKVTYENKETSISRHVSVIETTPPQLNLIGSTEPYVCPAKDYVEEGYSAIDNYDGDITSKVEKINEDNKIIYRVSDSSGNISENNRIIHYEDVNKPVITLKGNKTITLNIGEEYVEKGYTAADNCNGDLTSKVKVTNNINSNNAGVYKVTYTVEDDSHNTTSVTRTVKVAKIPTFNTRDISLYKEALTDYIISKNYKVSVGYYNLSTGASYYYKPNQIYYGASLVKTINALYTYEHMNLTPDIKNLVSIMISVSDNAAHQKLLKMAGYNNLKNYGRSIGARNYLSGSDNYGNTTVNDQMAVWKYFYRYINSSSMGKELSTYFINDYYNSLIFPGLPTTYHKYGWYSSYYHDTGIVLDKKPYIVVILTRHGNSNYREVVNDLSKKIYQLNQLT